MQSDLGSTVNRGEISKVLVKLFNVGINFDLDTLSKSRYLIISGTKIFYDGDSYREDESFDWKIRLTGSEFNQFFTPALKDELIDRIQLALRAKGVIGESDTLTF